jgi:hypothetical protein
MADPVSGPRLGQPRSALLEIGGKCADAPTAVPCIPMLLVMLDGAAFVNSARCRLVQSGDLSPPSPTAFGRKTATNFGMHRMP